MCLFTIPCNVLYNTGIGAGGEAVIMAEVSRVTTEEERTGILSTLISTRQIGLLVG